MEQQELVNIFKIFLEPGAFGEIQPNIPILDITIMCSVHDSLHVLLYAS